MVRTVEEALALREAGSGQICMREVQGRAPDGFDFGNSPFEISGVDFGAALRCIVGHGKGDRPRLLAASPDQIPPSLSDNTG